MQDFAADVYNQVVAALKADDSMAGKSEKEVGKGSMQPM